MERKMDPYKQPDPRLILNEPTLPDLRNVKQILSGIPAVSPSLAAELAGCDVRTVYRALKDGRSLERVPHGRFGWVSIRSLRQWILDKYGATAAFNAMEKYCDSLGKTDTCDNSRQLPSK
jgi:hypothetical protein